MMKRLQICCGVIAAALVLSGISGCGSDNSMSAQDEANLKMHDASKMKPPSGDQLKANKGRFKSSLASEATQTAGGPSADAPAGGSPGN